MESLLSNRPESQALKLVNLNLLLDLLDLCRLDILLQLGELSGLLAQLLFQIVDLLNKSHPLECLALLRERQLREIAFNPLILIFSNGN